MIEVACLHPYLETRRTDIEKGLYPRHHLWGIDAIEKNKEWNVTLLSTNKTIIPSLLEKVLDRYLFRNSPGTKAEIEAWRASKSNDLIFSVCGPLSLARHLKKTKLVSWVFRKQENANRRSNHPYSNENLASHAGFLCLTPNAQKDFEPHAKAIFLPWCVDQKLFDGKPAKEKPDRPFFLATGKTGRDYHTLVEAARLTKAEIRIIGPLAHRPDDTPENVNWTSSSSDPPDQAIDYPTLREWYAQCLAVCIPLSGNADDTCGYTNMLEAMAMRKPVLMTRSGCLHVDPESGEFGKLIEPQDSKGWTCAMNFLLQNQDPARSYGEAGRRLAEKEFFIERFNRDLLQFLQLILTN